MAHQRDSHFAALERVSVFGELLEDFGGQIGALEKRQGQVLVESGISGRAEKIAASEQGKRQRGVLRVSLFVRFVGHHCHSLLQTRPAVFTFVLPWRARPRWDRSDLDGRRCRESSSPGYCRKPRAQLKTDERRCPSWPR